MVPVLYWDLDSHPLLFTNFILFYLQFRSAKKKVLLNVSILGPNHGIYIELYGFVILLVQFLYLDKLQSHFHSLIRHFPFKIFYKFFISLKPSLI